MENFDNRNTKDPQTRRDSRTETLTKTKPRHEISMPEGIKENPQKVYA